MEIWHRHNSTLTTYLDVSGGLSEGYRILRQVLSPDDEIETNWQLTPAQSRQLRALLAADVINDALEPLNPRASFDMTLMSVLEQLEPAVQPVTFHTRD